MELDVIGIGKKYNKCYSDKEKYIKLYKNNFIVSSVINKIAEKLSNADIKDENNESQLSKKINNPNYFQSKNEFLKEFAIYIMACGWTAIHKRYTSHGFFDTLELVNLNPDNTDIDYTKEIVYTIIDGKSQELNISDVIIFYDILKNDETGKGQSRMYNLRSQIENISAAQKAKKIQIDNSGTTIVSPKSATNTNTVDEGLNAPVTTMGGGLRSQKEEMEDRLNENDIENRIIVSAKGLDATNLSTTLNSIKFHEIVESDALAVYDAYGFPVELSPYGKNATYENKEESENKLLEGQVLPLAENLIHSLNSEFPNEGKLTASFNHLSSMSIIESRIQNTNNNIINQYGTLFDKGIINENEYKEILKSKNIL